jgi:hypothetical protein
VSGPAPDDEDTALARYLAQAGLLDHGSLQAGLAEVAARRQARHPRATLGHVLLERKALEPTLLQQALVAITSQGATVSVRKDSAARQPTRSPSQSPSQSNVRPPLPSSQTGSQTGTGFTPIVPVASGALPPRPVPSTGRLASPPASGRFANPSGVARSSSGSTETRSQLRDAPERLGEYRLVRLLARGGMGAVHEALHEPSGVTRAIKVVLRGGLHGSEDPEQLARLKREAELLARLDHPHVVRVHAADFSSDPAYVVVDLLPGGSLEERLRQGPLPIADAVAIGRKLAGALAHAHTRGVLHRDVKPANVLFDDRGEPRLVDFGLAKADATSRVLTATGQVIGTPVYMSPEQALGLQVDARADVYGLGVLLWSMLTGRPPHLGASVTEVLARVTRDPLEPVTKLRKDVPPALAALVERATAKVAADRLPTAEALAAGLAALDGSGRRGRGPAPDAPAPAARRLVVGLSLAAAGAVLLGAVAVAVSTRRADPAATPHRTPAPTATASPSPPGRVTEPDARPASAARWTLEPDEGLEYAATLWLKGTNELAPSTCVHLLLRAVVTSTSPEKVTLDLRVQRARMRVTPALDRERRVIDDTSDVPSEAPPVGVRGALRAPLDRPLVVELDPRTGAVTQVTGARAIGEAAANAAGSRLKDEDDAARALVQFVDLWTDGAWREWLDAVSRGAGDDVRSAFLGGRLEWGWRRRTIEAKGGPAVEARALYRTKSVVLGPGDFISRVGRRLGVAWPTLGNLNSLDDPNKVVAGQRIEVPRPGTPDPAVPLPPGAPRVVEAAPGARAHARPWDDVVCHLPPGARFVANATLEGWTRIDLRGGAAWVLSASLRPVTGTGVAVIIATANEEVSLERPGSTRGKVYAARGQAYAVVGHEGDMLRLQFDEQPALIRSSSVRVE